MTEEQLKPEQKRCIKCFAIFTPSPLQSKHGNRKCVCEECVNKSQYKHTLIKCEVCGEMHVSLGAHLRKHGMKRKDYILKYPGKPITSPTFGAAILEGHMKPRRVQKESMCSICGKKFLPSETKTYKYCLECSQVRKKQECLLNDAVECQICKKKYRKITERHLKLHNITTENYKLQFPTSPIVSSSLNQQHINGKRGGLSQFAKRKKKLEKSGLKVTVYNNWLIYGKSKPYFAEKFIGGWVVDDDRVKAHIKECLVLGFQPVICTAKDFFKMKPFIKRGYDQMMLIKLIYQLKYKNKLKE